MPLKNPASTAPMRWIALEEQVIHPEIAASCGEADMASKARWSTATPVVNTSIRKILAPP